MGVGVVRVGVGEADGKRGGGEGLLCGVGGVEDGEDRARRRFGGVCCVVLFCSWSDWRTKLGVEEDVP